jgi:membrane protein
MSVDESLRSAAGVETARAAPDDAPSPASGAPVRWTRVGWRVFMAIFEHRILATSGGVAFFALMAIFPALATIVSLYSLFADPSAIPERLALLAGVVPASVIDLLKQEIVHLAQSKVGALSTAFVVGFLVSMWSANSGVAALFDAMNVVHGEREERSLMRFYVTTFAVTIGVIVFGLATLVGVLPITFRWLGLGESAETLADILRWPGVLLLAMIGLSAIYRIGPSRSEARWRWVTWGSGLSAILLVCASMVFAWYVAAFDSYERIYGSLGAVVAFMTWLWLSVVIVLLGAEVDAAVEREIGRGKTNKDKTRDA